MIEDEINKWLERLPDAVSDDNHIDLLMEASSELSSLRAELMRLRTCSTCDGDGIMDVIVGYDHDGEIYDAEECAECLGIGICHYAQVVDERDRLEAVRAQIAALPAGCTASADRAIELARAVIGDRE